MEFIRLPSCESVSHKTKTFLVVICFVFIQLHLLVRELFIFIFINCSTSFSTCTSGIEIMLARSPMVTGFGLGRVELIENHLFFARLASEEFISSASNVTCLFLNITYMLSCSLIFS